MLNEIIIRADDLGYSEGVNYGICKTVREGLIRNVGFMVNMPASAHGYALIRDLDVCLGLHINVSAGRPICSPDIIPSLVQADGTFHTSAQYAAATADFVAVDQAMLEIYAQYQRFRQITGREPDYFECHAVSSGNLSRAMALAAQQYHLPYQPASFDGSPTTFGPHIIYPWMGSHAPSYDPQDFLQHMLSNLHPDGYDLMIFHPGYLDDDILTHSSLTLPRVKEVTAACSAQTRALLAAHGIQLRTYRDLLHSAHSVF